MDARLRREPSPAGVTPDRGGAGAELLKFEKTQYSRQGENSISSQKQKRKGKWKERNRVESLHGRRLRMRPDDKDLRLRKLPKYATAKGRSAR